VVKLRACAASAQRFGVSYRTAGCWYLPRELRFTPQRPEKRASQGNEEAIEW